MKQTNELRAEAQEALAKVWFIQRIEELEHTDSFLARVETLIIEQELW